MIERVFAKVAMGTTNNQFMLISDFLNDSLGLEFTTFVNHIKGVTWKLPLHLKHGVVQGLQVKSHQKILSNCLNALVEKPVQAVIKLSCAYFTPRIVSKKNLN